MTRSRTAIALAAALALAVTPAAATAAPIDDRVAALEATVQQQHEVIALLLADRDRQWTALSALDQILRVQRDATRSNTTRIATVEYQVIQVNNRLVPLELLVDRLVRRVTVLWRRRG